jgi:hypothetical protein
MAKGSGKADKGTYREFCWLLLACWSLAKYIVTNQQLVSYLVLTSKVEPGGGGCRFGMQKRVN